MRIVIDLQGAQGKGQFQSKGYYFLKIALEIVRNRGTHDVLIALNGQLVESIEFIRAAFDGLLPAENIRIWFTNESINSIKTKKIWQRNTAELVREAFLASLEPDMVLVTSLFEGFADDSVYSIGLGPYHIPTTVISYDLFPLMQSSIYFDSNLLYKKLYTRSVEFLKRADLYFASSNFLGRKFIDCLNLDPNRVINIPVSTDSCFQPISISEEETERKRRNFGLTKPFVMCSRINGTTKCHLQLIKAFSLLSDEIKNSYHLVLIGSMPDESRIKVEKYAQIHDLNHNDVILIDKISNEDLARLYNLAALFVFFPHCESFFLPALEAMSCGTPTIGANTAILREIISCDEALFDPHNVFMISQKIADILKNHRLREQLVKHGLEQAQSFSWSKSAKKAILAFEQLHAISGLSSRRAEPQAFYIQWLIDKITKLPYKSVSAADLMQVASAIAQNHPQRYRRQLLIDISELAVCDHRTGIQRVVRSIIAELLVNPPVNFKVELVYANPQGGSYRYARKFTQEFLARPLEECECTDEVITVFSQDIFLGLDLAYRVVLNHQPFYKHLKLIGAKVYFVVHDLLPILNPEVFPIGIPDLHAQWMNVMAKMDGLICVSRAVADDVIDWLNVFGPKRTSTLNIGWFHLGADLANSMPTTGLPAQATEILDILSNFPTFLMVGTVEPRKRQLQALLAFERLWAKGYQINLVIVGKHGWDVDLLIEMLKEHPENGRHLFWFSQVSDEFLEKIYTNSTCLIAASAGEGFGLPLIEAALHRIPIIARDIPVFREVAGGNAFYFTGTTAASLESCVVEWLKLDKPPSSAAMPWLTWKQSKEQLLNVILEDHWYHKWISDHTLRYWGNDPRLESPVGNRIGRSIISTGKAGYLIDELHIALVEGLYEIILHGCWVREISDKAYIEFIADNKQTVIYRRKLNETLEVSGIAVLLVSLQGNTSSFVLRIWIDEQTHIEISMIEIKTAEKNLVSSNFKHINPPFLNEISI